MFNNHVRQHRSSSEASKVTLSQPPGHRSSARIRGRWFAKFVWLQPSDTGPHLNTGFGSQTLTGDFAVLI